MKAYWSDAFRHDGKARERYTLLVPGVYGEARPHHAGSAYRPKGAQLWRISGHSYILEGDAPLFTDREHTRLPLLHDRLRDVGDEIEQLRREQSALIAAIAEEDEDGS
jgi:hypothetical protein